MSQMPLLLHNVQLTISIYSVADRGTGEAKRKSNVVERISRFLAFFTQFLDPLLLLYTIVKQDFRGVMFIII